MAVKADRMSVYRTLDVLCLTLIQGSLQDVVPRSSRDEVSGQDVLDAVRLLERILEILRRLTLSRLQNISVLLRVGVQA